MLLALPSLMPAKTLCTVYDNSGKPPSSTGVVQLTTAATGVTPVTLEMVGAVGGANDVLANRGFEGRDDDDGVAIVHTYPYDVARRSAVSVTTRLAPGRLEFTGTHNVTAGMVVDTLPLTFTLAGVATSMHTLAPGAVMEEVALVAHRSSFRCHTTVSFVYVES